MNDNTQTTTTNSATDDQAILELNKLLSLQIPTEALSDPQKVDYWEKFFKIIRDMYNLELVSIPNVPQFVEKFRATLDPEKFLTTLADMAADKLRENEDIQGLVEQDEFNGKLTQVLQALPADQIPVFIDNLFKGNPPQKLLDELGLVYQVIPQFTPEEIEIMQQGRIKDVLESAKRRPIDARDLATSPGFNKPFTPDEISNIVNQFGTNYQQVKNDQQRNPAVNNIPDRYVVKPGQNTNNSGFLEPIQPMAFPRNRVGVNSPTDPIPANQFSQVRAMPAKNVPRQPTIQMNQAPRPNTNFVNPFPNGQGTGPMPRPQPQRSAIGNPIFNGQRRAMPPRPIPVFGYRPNANFTRPPANNFVNSQPTITNNIVNNSPDLPHRHENDLNDLLHGMNKGE